MARKRDKTRERSMVRERIKILFEKAEERALAGELEGADRCVELARALGMKYNVRAPAKFKRFYCKHCYRFLLPGRTSKSRVNSGQRRVEVKCLSCDGIMYYPLSKK